MKDIEELWEKRKDTQGKIELTVFFVNIFLFLCHIFFMIIYAVIGHTFMSIINIFSILLYLYYIPRSYKNIDQYMGMAFLEIWIHQICGILSFGWTPCYQNWCFGMLVAYFLPAFNPEVKSAKQRPMIYAIIIIISYFFMATFYPLLHLDMTIELDIYKNSILFIANNSFAFIAISLFALFYTSSSYKKEKELSKKAEYDELTDLYNRHAINEICTKLVSIAKEKNKAYHVAILDIDFFKKINDKYGHPSGDLVLKKIANILKKHSVKGIIPGRWGGEEFVMFAPHYLSYSVFTNILEKMRKEIEEEQFEIENNKSIKVTISIGSASIKDYITVEDAISKADTNLYQAKKTGRNKLVK